MTADDGSRLAKNMIMEDQTEDRILEKNILLIVSNNESWIISDKKGLIGNFKTFRKFVESKFEHE